MRFWYSSGENDRCALFGSANDDEDSPGPQRENLPRIATNKRKPSLVSKGRMAFLLKLKAFTSLVHLLSTTTLSVLYGGFLHKGNFILEGNKYFTIDVK